MSDIWGQFINDSPYKPTVFGAGDPNILFVGSEKSGKTSILNEYLSLQENVQETLALTYHNKGIEINGDMTPLHVWELGGGLQLESILDTVVNESTQSNFLIFICLDLSSASSIIDAVDWIERIDARFGDKKRGVFFIGTHYDQFEGKDSREKEIIVRGLRAIAAQHNAGILFCSIKDSDLDKKIGNIVNLVFNNLNIKDKVNSNSQPIIICPGDDNDYKNDSDSVSTMMNTMSQEAANEHHKSPRESLSPAEGKNFQETEIDQIYKARKTELTDQIKKKNSKHASPEKRVEKKPRESKKKSK